MSRLLMSTEEPAFIRAMEEKGFDIIPTERIDSFLQPEQYHADMQALVLGNRLYTLKDCVKPIGKDYPANVRLNCLLLGNRLYGKLSAVDDIVLDYCRENGIETVNVNQGYTRCSTLVAGDNAVITADRSIAEAMKNNGVEVLPISAGHIRLKGFDYGFIGGCTCRVERTVYSFGNIKKHPDYEAIKAFLYDNDSILEICCEEMPLTDIGGAVSLSSCGHGKADSALQRFSSALSSDAYRSR